jgi:hypothetical protein
MSSHSPSAYRRRGRNDYSPNTLPSDVCPYAKNGWQNERKAAEWLEGWKQAECEEEEMNKKMYKLPDIVKMEQDSVRTFERGVDAIQDKFCSELAEKRRLAGLDEENARLIAEIIALKVSCPFTNKMEWLLKKFVEKLSVAKFADMGQSYAISGIVEESKRLLDDIAAAREGQ